MKLEPSAGARVERAAAHGEAFGTARALVALDGLDPGALKAY